jgi:hypothetical protein
LLVSFLNRASLGQNNVFLCLVSLGLLHFGGCWAVLGLRQSR